MASPLGPLSIEINDSVQGVQLEWCGASVDFRSFLSLPSLARAEEEKARAGMQGRYEEQREKAGSEARSWLSSA